MKEPVSIVAALLALGLGIPMLANADASEIGATVVELMPHASKLVRALNLTAEQQARLIEMRRLCTRMLRQTLDDDQFAKLVASDRAGRRTALSAGSSLRASLRPVSLPPLQPGTVSQARDAMLWPGATSGAAPAPG